jgi:GT2 family glycosyltransferase
MSNFDPPPRISVILVTWNSAVHLSRCLGCLMAQTHKDFEVVLVDNGSMDGSLDGVESRWPGLTLRVERLDKNKGFAAANNLGARLARGHWLALLNADAFPAPDWLEQLLRAAKENPQYTFFTSRQIQINAPELLDGTGDAYHISGLAWRQNYNQPVDKYGLQPEEVFSACAAAALYIREDFLNVSGFDEDYFSYFEDVDLSFRLRLAGGRCLYVPQAVVLHVGSVSSGKTSDFVIYHGHRNLVWTYFKDMPGILMLLFLPLHLVMNVYFIISFSLQGKIKVILKSKRDAFLKLLYMLRKRKKIQQTRVITFKGLLLVMNKDPLAPLWANIIRRRKN